MAFSQNEDGDLEKLEEIVCQNISPVAAVINLMPFRLGAGPMGGDAKRRWRFWIGQMSLPEAVLSDESYTG